MRLTGLFGRAYNRAIGTEHAAVAGFGFQQRMAGRAFVKELTGVGRHVLGTLMSAVRAGKSGFQDDGITHGVAPHCAYDILSDRCTARYKFLHSCYT